MALRASVPVNKEILATTYPTSFEGAQVFADALAYGHLKPSFAGYEEFNTVLQGELDENVFMWQRSLSRKKQLLPCLTELIRKGT